jgi:hypothetical protein
MIYTDYSGETRLIGSGGLWPRVAGRKGRVDDARRVLCLACFPGRLSKRADTKPFYLNQSLVSHMCTDEMSIVELVCKTCRSFWK